MTIYLIGIGGIGLSSIARLLKMEGHTVVGADMIENTVTKELQEEGIEVHIGHDVKNIPSDCELVLISPSVLSSTPADYEEAQKKGIKTQTWQEYVGEITKNKKTIAICGTHGKSNTTAMVARVLIDAGMDPTVIIGTKLTELNDKNVRKGESEWLVLEADEFHENFLNYHPNYIVCTSVDVDHLDYFGTEKNYHAAFQKFFNTLEEGEGTLIIHNKDKALFSFQNFKEVIAEDTVSYKLSTPGEYNRENAALVEALGKELGIKDADVKKSLQGYAGAWRRMEVVGESEEGALVIDDYGHHPKEVKAALQAVKEGYPDKKVICVFQPHQYSRTIQFIDAFTECFADADVLLIPNIYESRDSEDDKRAMSAKKFVDKVREKHRHILYTESLEGTLELLEDDGRFNSDETVIITMGAGDVTNLAHWLVDGTSFSSSE